jgi:AAA domain
MSQRPWRGPEGGIWVPGDYSSSVSGDRPDEVERIRKRLEETNPGPPDLEWTGYFNGEEMVNGGPIPTPPGPTITEPWWPEGKPPGWDTPDGTFFPLKPLADVRSEPVSWLWPGRIPLGKITVLDGDPKLGKTTTMLDIIARVTTGRPMPDGLPGIQGNCWIMTVEDGHADTIKPRILAAGGDADRAFVEVSEDEAIYLSEHLDLIVGTIKHYELKLVMIDPFMGYLGPKSQVSSNSDQDVRTVLGPLARAVGKAGCAVVLIRHLNKSVGQNALHRGGGSVGIIGAARASLLVVRHPDADPEDPNPKRVVASNGGNLASVPASLSFRMDSVQVVDDGVVLPSIARLAWDPTPTGHTAASLLAPKRDEPRTRADAGPWLTDILMKGQADSKDVEEAAREMLGISHGTLMAARKLIGAKARKVGGEQHGRWVIYLESHDHPKDAHKPGCPGYVPPPGPQQSDLELYPDA